MRERSGGRVSIQVFPSVQLGINRDITEQRQAQRRIEEANATLEDRVRERTAQLEAAIAVDGPALVEAVVPRTI
mgnify:CR=1 FL=1